MHLGSPGRTSSRVSSLKKIAGGPCTPGRHPSLRRSWHRSPRHERTHEEDLMNPWRTWAAATVLVTGVTGFFGGWLARSLVDRGARVVAVVRAPREQSQFFMGETHKDVDIEWGSVCDPGLL